MSNDISNLLTSPFTPTDISELAESIAKIHKSQTAMKDAQGREIGGNVNFLGSIKKELIPVLPIIIAELEKMGFKYEHVV